MTEPLRWLWRLCPCKDCWKRRNPKVHVAVRVSEIIAAADHKALIQERLAELDWAKPVERWDSYGLDGVESVRFVGWRK